MCGSPQGWSIPLALILYGAIAVCMLSLLLLIVLCRPVLPTSVNPFLSLYSADVVVLPRHQCDNTAECRSTGGYSGGSMPHPFDVLKTFRF